MKYLAAILLILQVSILQAQKDFEGMIRYRGISGAHGARTIGIEEPDTADIKIYFTPGKILILTNKDNDEAEERTLVLIDSAKSYSFDMNDKKYRVKKLKVIKQVVAVPERIAGYMASPFSGGLGNSSLVFGVNATLWFADSLFFTVPAKYEGNDELLMVRNNHILLKAFINPGNIRTEENYEADKNYDADSIDEVITAITLEAIEIAPGKINPSDFSIPTGFMPWSYYSVSPDTAYSEITDSTTILVDSAISIPAIEPVKTKETVPAKSKSSKAKTSSKPGFRKED